MSCACGMDSVGTCLVCGARLCSEHALRDPVLNVDHLTWHLLGVMPADLLGRGTFPSSLDRVRSDLRPLLRFQAQRQAFLTGLRGSGVICGNCRFNGACRAAGATQPTAPALEAGGSQRLRDAVAAYLLGDNMPTWDSMASDAAVKDALFQDLIHLAREKAERVQVPVEWEAWLYTPGLYSGGSPRWMRGEVRATEEVFHVVNVPELTRDHPDRSSYYAPSPRYVNRHGLWGPIGQPVEVIVKKAGWFSPEERVFQALWSDAPPQPGLDNILKRAAQLLAPAAREPTAKQARKEERKRQARAADLGLRFDGLYLAAKEHSSWPYLRFYADGTVLSVSSSGNPKQVARWLDKTHTNFSRGTYTVQGRSIEFSTVSSEGTVAYKGQVFDGTIELSSHSYINGHKARRTFGFVQVALH